MGKMIKALQDNLKKIANNVYDEFRRQINSSYIGHTSLRNDFLGDFGKMYSSYGRNGQNFSIIAKNYQYTKNSLELSEYNEKGWYIGYLANPYRTEDVATWYKKVCKGYSDYSDYMLDKYFSEESNGDNSNSRNVSQLETIGNFNLELSKYNINTHNGWHKRGKDKATATRLDAVSDKFREDTINAAFNGGKPKSLTNKVYDGMILGGEFQTNDRHMDGEHAYEDALNGRKSAIGWSTSDNSYNTSMRGVHFDNEDYLDSMYGTSKSSDDYSDTFDDEVRGLGGITNYSNFTNYYSLTYSEGLLENTNEKIKGFIAKSIYGYNLLDEESGVNGESLKKGANSLKKYYPSYDRQTSSNYVDMMTLQDVTFVHKGGQKQKGDTLIRITLNEAGNPNLAAANVLYMYAEAEGERYGNVHERILTVDNYTANGGAENGTYKIYEYNNLANKKDLLFKTNRDFLKKKYDTLIARFHTDEPLGNAPRDMISTAVSKYFGMSHGRNLLKKAAKGGNRELKTNGYSDPYCRVWTYHKQYHRLKDTIRPFEGQGFKESEFAVNIRANQEHLDKWGVRSTENGLVKIAPKNSDVNEIKKCMFSIENLAWKNEPNIPCIGPNGGRIMWFPPYDLSFNENVHTNWNPNSFIGRGEKIYTYTDTERGGTLRFKLLIDHPSIVDTWKQDVGGGTTQGDVDDVDSNEQTLLRFFAGCEVLDTNSNNSIFKEREIAESLDNGNKNGGEKPIEYEDVIEQPTTTKDSIIFFVYFPNNYSGGDDAWNGEVKPMHYLANGVNGNYTNFGKANIPTQIEERFYTDGVLFEDCHGYEMESGDTLGNGVTYTDVGLHIPCFEENHSATSDAYGKHALVCENINGGTNFWWYRTDESESNQVMHSFSNEKRYNESEFKPSSWEYISNDSKIATQQLNYCDTRSYGLNSKGYDKVLDSRLTKHFITQNDVDNGKLYSFAEVFKALESSVGDWIDDYIDDDRVEELKNLLENSKISEIILNGYASTQGYNANNVANSGGGLSRRRSWAVYEWMKFSSFSSLKKATYTIGEHFQQPSDDIDYYTDTYNNNDFMAKVWRCVRVEIKFDKSEVIKTPQSNNKGVDNVEHLDDKAYREAQAHRNDEAYDVGKRNAEIAREEQAQRKEDAKNEGNTFQKAYIGYDYDESIYFEELERNAPFLHSKITDKIKYFDPAFHSISPEGFNARLTFLHQCTRQGSTFGASEGTNNSKNMAFGAPPVCVLRIGDFFNTRIIIESLNINYDNNGVQWDLNDEGIGVMPMIADIDISFKFIGGSDLGGPIRRLQNAVSFNYYANTSVYDSNAETTDGNNVDNEENNDSEQI